MRKSTKQNMEKITCIVFVLLITLVCAFINGNITGMTTYGEESQTQTWNFDNAGDYIYDDSLIIIEDGDVELVSTKSTTYWNTSTATDYSITSAIYKTNDKISKVESLDDEKQQINQGEVYDITFSNSIDNEDNISLYLESNWDGDMHLCDESVFCDSPGYGSISFSNVEGWYHITVSDLNNPKTSFRLNTDKTKINYIKATNIEIEQHSSTETTYPTSASIETEDLSPSDLGGWNDFSKEQTLNSQTIDYQYSIDSGSSWTDVPEDNDLSSVDSESIRFKAILGSDETNTPILESMALDYTSLVCIEDWLAFYGDCLINNKKLKHYIETNECRTLNNLPSDNATYINCDHCTPNWQEINRSCQPDDTITNYYRDLNNCYTQTHLVSDRTQPNRNTYSCDYCSINDCSDSHKTLFSKQEDEILQVDFKNITNTYLEINKSDSVTNAEVSVIEYKRNIKNKTISQKPLNRYLEIESNITNIESVKIVVYYNDTEINNQNLIESSLNIHYYNETSEEWEELDSIVNTTGNYVYAIVNHLSHYGVFGQERSSESSSSTSTSSSSATTSSNSGGGGGWIITTNKKKKKIETKPEEQVTAKQITQNLELSKEEECDFKVNLPNKISFIENDFFEGEIMSEGNCNVKEIKVYLSHNLKDEIKVSHPSSIKDNKKINFFLNKKQEIEKKWHSFLTGFESLDEITVKIITGYLTLEAVDEKGFVFEKKIEIEVETMNTETKFNSQSIIIVLPFLIILIAIMILIFTKKRKKKKTQKGNNKKRVKKRKKRKQRKVTKRKNKKKNK